MPTVPFTPRSQGAAPKVDKEWLMVAAGDLHAEGRLFEPVGSGKYLGEIKPDSPEHKEWNETWSEGVGFDKGKRTIKGKTPEEYMKGRSPDEEGTSLPGSDIFLIRKRAKPNDPESVPMT